MQIWSFEARFWIDNTRLPVFTLGLVVRDYRRNEFHSWEVINKRGDSLHLGVEDTPGNIERLNLFTNATIVPIEDKRKTRPVGGPS
jgi:hypothetical protein